MSKPVKELIRKELVRRFDGLDSLAVVGFTGIDAITTHRIRGRLQDKNIRLTVVKNSVARQAFEAIGLMEAQELMSGPCAVAYSIDKDDEGAVVTVVRELLEIHRETPNFTVKAAVLDHEVFGSDKVQALSQFPTREESKARAVTCILSPGRKLAACLIGPGARIASILKTIQEKKEGPGGDEAAA